MLSDMGTEYPQRAENNIGSKLKLLYCQLEVLTIHRKLLWYSVHIVYRH